MIASCSSRRSKRSPTGGNGMPYAACSASYQPAPSAELHAAAAYLVDARDGDRERTRVPEGRRGDQRPEPDPAGLDGEAGQGGPGVGRPGLAGAAAELQVVVGAEERVEAEVLRRPGDAAERRVAGPLLGLGEDPESHASMFAHAAAPRAAVRPFWCAAFWLCPLSRGLSWPRRPGRSPPSGPARRRRIGGTEALLPVHPAVRCPGGRATRGQWARGPRRDRRPTRGTPPR